MMTKVARATSLRRKLCVSTVLAGGMLLAVPGYSQTGLPNGPTIPPGGGTPTFVVDGSVVPAGSVNGSGDILQVNLVDTRTVINWTNFDIDTNKIVSFTDGTAVDLKAVLNRDLSGNMSEIYGALQSDSNISVYLINTSGILFGFGADVNVGSLIASTLDLDRGDPLTTTDDNNQFLAGDLSLGGSSTTSSIRFNGPLTSSAGITVGSGAVIRAIGASGGLGQLVLIGASVEAGAASVVTSGSGSTRDDVAFIAGTDVTVARAPDSPLSFTISQGTRVANAITANGDVAGRNVTLAFASRDTFTDTLLLNGTVTATTASATDRGVVLAAGTSANGVTVSPPVSGTETGGIANIGIGGTVSASDGGTAANTADVEIRARNSIFGSGSADIEATDAVSISSTQANVNLPGVTRSGGNATITAATNATLGPVTSTAGNIFVGAADIGNGAQDLSLSASAGSITLSGAARGRDVALNAGTTINTQAITARDDIVFRSTGAATLGAVTSGATVDALAPVDTNATGAADGLAGALIAGNDIDGVANGLVLNGAARANGTGSDIRLGGGAGGIGSGAVDLDLGATGSILLSSAARGRDIALNGGGTVSTQSLTARDDIAIRATGSATIGDLVSGTTVDSQPPLDTAGAADTLVSATLTGQNIDVAANGLSFTTATAVNNVSLNGGTGAASGADATATSGSVRLNGASVSLSGTATAGVDVIAGSAGAITIGAASAGDDIKITSTGSTAFLGSATLTGTGTDSLSGPGDANNDGRVLRVQGATGATLGSGSGSFTRAASATGTAEVIGGSGDGVVNLASSSDLTTVSGANASATVTGGSALTIGTLSATNGDATATTGGDLTINNLSAAGADPRGDAVVTSGGVLTLGTVSVRDLTVTATGFGGGITGAGISRDISITDTEGDASVGGVTAARNLTVVAEDGDLQVNFANIQASSGSVSLDTLPADGEIILVGEVRSATGQTFGSAVRLGATTALTNASGTIDFQSTLDGTQGLTISNGGTTRFQGAVGGDTVLAFLNVASGTTSVEGGRVNTLNQQNFAGNLTVSGPTTSFTSAGTATGDITFGGTLNGASAVTVTTGGDTTFNGSIGNDLALSSLTVNGAAFVGGSASLIRTTGAQTFNDDVTMFGNASLLLVSTDAEAIAFNGTLNGGRVLSVNTGGATTFAGEVGGSSPLASLTTDSVGTLAIGADITTNGFQNLGWATTLTGDSTLTSNSGAAITLGGTVNGAFNLSVVTSGITTFSGVVGGSAPLASLTTDAPGSTVINAAGISTVGDLNYNDDVSITADTTVSGANVTFGGDIEGPRALTVNSPGITTFSGRVGNPMALASLTTDAGGTTRINGITVATTGAQTYNDDVVLGVDTSLSGTSGTFEGLSGNGNSLTLFFTNTDINGDFAGIDLLDVTSLSIDFSGQSLSAADVLLDGTLGFLTGGGPVTGGTINATNSITVTGGSIDLDGAAAGTGDLRLTAREGSIVLDAGSGTDVALDSSGTISTGALVARDDIVIRSVGTTTTGALTSGATIGANGPVDSPSGDFLGSRAGADIQIRANGIVLTGPVRTNTSPSASSSDVLLNGGAGGVGNGSNDVDIRSAGGIDIIGTARGIDVALSAAGSVTTNDIQARDDVAIRSSGSFIRTGAVTSGTTVDGQLPTDADGAADDLLPAVDFTGNDIDLAAGSIVTGALRAFGANSDIRINGATGDAAQDINYSADGDITTGDLKGVDVALGAVGSVTTANVDARDDIAIRAGNAAVINGALTSGATVDSVSAVDQAGTADTLAARTLTGNQIDIGAGAGGISIAANVTTPGLLTLSSGAGITQTAGVVTADTLTGSSAGTTLLDASTNQIVALDDFSAGDFRLLDGGGLNVVGTVTGTNRVTIATSGTLAVDAVGSVSSTNAPISLTASGAASEITLGGAVNAGSGTLTLVAGDAISQAGFGIVTAGSLTGSSGGATNLATLANQVANLGSFNSSGFTFRNDPALTVAGPVNAGSGALSLEVVGDPIAINGNLTGVGVSVRAAGVTQAAASTINSGSGTVLIDADDGTITMAGAIVTTNAGASAVRIIDSGNATLGNITAASGTVVLGEAGGDLLTGTVSQTAGTAIVAGALVGNVGGSATLTTSGNNVGTLGAFAANGFSFTDANSLTVAGPVNAGTGDLTLQVTTGPLTLAGNLTAAGTTTLNALNGPISQTGGRIATAVLTGQSVGGTSLNSATNDIATLAGFTNSGSGGISLVDGRNLTITAAVNAGPGDLTLTAPGINFAGQTLTAGQDVVLDGQIGALTGATVNGGNNATGTGASINIGSVTAGAGALALAATNGDLTLGTGSAGTTGNLRTTGGGGDVIVTTSLSSATGSTIVSVGDARLASVSATGGDVKVTAAGQVTGLTRDSLATDGRAAPFFNRANLIAGGTGSDVIVSAGTLAQLGTVQANDAVTVTADQIDVASATATNGALSLTADISGLTIGTGTAGTSANLIKTGAAGQITFGTVTAGTDALASSSTSIAGNTLVATSGSATLNAVQAISVGTIDAGTSITATGRSIGVDLADAGTTLALTANNGPLTLGTGTAGTTATLRTTGGGAAGDVTVTTSVSSAAGTTIESISDARIASASASNGNVSVTAAGEVTGVGAGGRANLTAGGAGSDVNVAGGTLARLGTVDAADAVTITADVVDVSTARARTGDLSAAADVGSLTLGTGEGLDVALSSAANLSAGTVSARDDIVIRATGAASAGTLTSGATVSGNGPADVNGAGDALAGAALPGNVIDVRAGAVTATNANAAGNLALQANNGSVALGTGTAGGTANLSTTGGAGDVIVSTSLTSAGTATINSVDDATLAFVRSSGGNVLVDAADAVDATTLQAAGLVDVEGASASVGTATAGTSLAIRALAGQLTLGTGTALTTATLTKQGGTGELEATTLNAGGETTIASSTNARVGDITSSGGNATVTAAAGEVTGIGTGGRANVTAQNDTRDVTITAGTLARLGNVTAGNDLTVTAGNSATPLNGSIDATNATARTGALTLTAFNGDVRLGTGVAGTTANLSTTGTSGDVVVTASLTSAGNTIVTSADDTDLLLVRSTGGNVAVTAADAANAGTLAANGSVNVDGASSAIGTATAGTSLNVLARSGQLTLGTGTAGTTATLTKQGSTGELQVTTLNAGGNATIASSTNAALGSVTSSGGQITVDSVGTTTAGTLAAAGLIDVDGASAVVGTATAGTSLDVLARSGQLTLGTGTAGTTATLTKQGAVGELQAMTLNTGGETTITSSTNARLANVTSTGGNVVVTAASGEVTGVGANGRANILAQNDARDVTVTAGTLARLGDATAGNDFTVTAGNASLAGSIDVTNATARTGALTLAAFSGDILVGSGVAATTASLTTSGTGDVIVTNSLTSGGNATITSADDTDLRLVRSTGGNIVITASDAANSGTLQAADSIGIDGASIDTGTATAGTSLTMLARSGQLTLGTGTVGTTATMTKQGGTGELQVTSLTSGGNAVLTSSTNERLGTITSGTGDITLTATNGSITGLAAGSDFAGADINANGGVQLRAGQAGLVRLSDVNATRGSIDIEAGTTAAATSRVEVLDTVSSAGAYRITGGSVALGDDGGAEAQRAVGLVAVTATNGAITGGAGLTLQSNSDGAGAEALTLTANGTGGAIAFAASSQILGGTANGSDVTLDTVGKATAGQVTATGRTIAINANDLDLLGASGTDLAARVTAATVNITNRSDVANTTRLGDGPAGSAGFDVTQAEVNRVAAGTVTIESAAQDVQIGALALTTAVGSTRLNIQNTGRIDVTGVVEAEGSTDSRTIMLGGNAADAANDPPSRRSSVIRVASTASGGGRLLMGGANLDLRGAKIGVGQDNQFLESIGLTPGGSPIPVESVANDFIASPNSTLYAAKDKYTDGTILTASSLTVTYSDYALFQNTALPVFQPSGAVIGALGVNGILGLTSSGTSAANGFALFGEINGRTGSQAAVLGPDTIVLTEVNRSNTRINGCVVGSSGGCLVNAVATPNLNVFDSSQVNILRTADDLALSFDPVVGTNNEALFAGLASIDPIAEDAQCEDPESERCPERQEDQ